MWICDLCLEITVFPFFTWQLSLCLGRSWANQSTAGDKALGVMGDT